MESGIILLWSGTVATIPTGFVLCDGNNGTPNLTDRFVVGAGGTYNPNDTGDDSVHGHSISAEAVPLAAGILTDDVSPAGYFDSITVSHNHGGETGINSVIPPYYALAYIMKT